MKRNSWTAVNSVLKSECQWAVNKVSCGGAPELLKPMLYNFLRPHHSHTLSEICRSGQLGSYLLIQRENWTPVCPDFKDAPWPFGCDHLWCLTSCFWHFSQLEGRGQNDLPFPCFYIILWPASVALWWGDAPGHRHPHPRPPHIAVHAALSIPPSPWAARPEITALGNI